MEWLRENALWILAAGAMSAGPIYCAYRDKSDEADRERRACEERKGDVRDEILDQLGSNGLALDPGRIACPDTCAEAYECQVTLDDRGAVPFHVESGRVTPDGGSSGIVYGGFIAEQLRNRFRKQFEGARIDDVRCPPLWRTTQLSRDPRAPARCEAAFDGATVAITFVVTGADEPTLGAATFDGIVAASRLEQMGRSLATADGRPSSAFRSERRAYRTSQIVRCPEVSTEFDPTETQVAEFKLTSVDDVTARIVKIVDTGGPWRQVP